MSDERKFTVEEFRAYLRKQHSFGDAFYNLNIENVENAQHKHCSDCALYKTCDEKFDRPVIYGDYIACDQYDEAE